jgi:hypothetical protein
LVFAACNPEDKVEFLSERFSLFVKDGCTAVFPNGERYVCNTVIWAPEPIAPEPENPEPVDQE